MGPNTEMTALLTAVESAPWGEGDGLTGCEIWGRCDDPRDDADHFTYRRAVRHSLRGAKTAADAYAAARAAGLSGDDMMDDLRQAAEDELMSCR